MGVADPLGPRRDRFEFPQGNLVVRRQPLAGTKRESSPTSQQDLLLEATPPRPPLPILDVQHPPHDAACQPSRVWRRSSPQAVVTRLDAGLIGASQCPECESAVSAVQ